jgi:phage I-like protein
MALSPLKIEMRRPRSVAGPSRRRGLARRRLPAAPQGLPRTPLRADARRRLRHDQPMSLRLPALAFMSAAAPAAPVPDWVHLVPVGPDGMVRTRDHRGPYRLDDPAAVIAASLAEGRLPIDENHALDRAAAEGLPSPARGWIVAIEARPDGLWGRVEWTPEGAHLVASRAYLALSPAVRIDADRRITAVLRASLVNTPNLRGIAALNTETGMTLAERLAETLGLDAGAGEDAILAAVARLRDGPALHSEIAAALGLDGTADRAALIGAAAAAAKGKAAVAALQSEIAGLAARLEAQTRAASVRFVDAAIVAGRVGVRPLRDHYIARHMADPEAVAREFAALPVMPGSEATAAPPPGKGTVALNDAERAVARALGVSDEAFIAARAAQREAI